jgi:AcrR family transcriptional regulator
MDTSRAAGPGLRERKKQQTREALSWAALRLAVERGLGNVLVEDIAAEAGVSPRTYNNYFSSKAEAITWRHLDRARRMADHASPQPEWTAGVRLMLSEPELQGEFLKAGAAAERECALVIAERTGTDADRDMYPRLVAAAIGTAILVANEQWLRAEPPVPLAPLLRDALTQIAAGLPAPATR